MKPGFLPAIFIASLMLGACGDATAPPVDPADTSSSVGSLDTSDNPDYVTLRTC
jgi:hypothetical protein